MVDENFIQEAYDINDNNSVGSFEMNNKDPIITRETTSSDVIIEKKKSNIGKKAITPQIKKETKPVKKKNYSIKNHLNKAIKNSEKILKKTSVLVKNKVNFPNKKGEVKKRKKSKARLNNIITIVAVIAIIAISLIIINMDSIFSNDVQPVAIINGEVMTTEDIGITLRTVPSSYRSLMTDDIILNQTIINFLLMQESRKAGLEANENEAEEKINEAIALSQLSKSEFKEYLQEQNMTYEDMVEFYRVHLSIENFLLSNVYNDVTVSENDIIAFYNQNKDRLGNVTLEEVSLDIEEYLLQEKQAILFEEYISELVTNADIRIIGDESVSNVESSFSSEEVEKYSNCAVSVGLDKNSIIFVYSDSCPYCTRMKPIVRDLEENYGFYWANSADSSARVILRECFSDVLAGGVPQFICAKNGENLVGEKPKAVLEDFAIACNS